MGLSAPWEAWNSGGQGPRRIELTGPQIKQAAFCYHRLSPKFEVQPQSGGHWPRTSEPERHRPFCPCRWEFESRPSPPVPYLGLPPASDTKGSLSLPRPGCSGVSSVNLRCQAPWTRRHREGGGEAGGSWCCFRAAFGSWGSLVRGARWARIAPAADASCGHWTALSTQALCPACSIPSSLEHWPVDMGIAYCSGGWCPGPTSEPLRCNSRWHLSTNPVRSGGTAGLKRQMSPSLGGILQRTQG